MNMDLLTRQLTAFSSFDEMVNRTHEGYRPSLYPYKYAPGMVIAEYKALADAYDSAQKAKGDLRRAYRGSDDFWKTYRNKKLNDSAPIVHEREGE